MPAMPLPRGAAAALCLGGLLAGCRTGAPVVPVFRDAPIRMTFSAPAGQELGERTVMQLQGAGLPSSTVTAQTRTAFRPTGEGFAVTQVTSRLEVNGEAALLPPPLRFEVAADGAFIRLAPGPDGRVDEIVEAKVRREWESDFQRLLGPDLNGRVQRSVEAINTGTGPLTFILERKLLGTTTTPFGDALAFGLSCRGALPTGEEADAELEAELLQRGQPPLEPSVVCEGMQVMARRPFLPVRTELSLKARLAGGELSFRRDTQTEALATAPSEIPEPKAATETKSEEPNRR